MAVLARACWLLRRGRRGAGGAMPVLRLPLAACRIGSAPMKQVLGGEVMVWVGWEVGRGCLRQLPPSPAEEQASPEPKPAVGHGQVAADLEGGGLLDSRDAAGGDAELDGAGQVVKDSDADADDFLGHGVHADGSWG
jgi:hypothetical protein